MKQSILPLTLAVAYACLPTAARAEIKPNRLFSDNAVLQHGIGVPVWGTGRDGEKVTVKFQGQSVAVTVQDGRWMARLKSLKAGGPFTLTLAGDNTITLTNILVGEVWVCSGQSNMEFPLNRAVNGAEAIAAAQDSQLRLFTVPRGASDAPRTE